MIYGVACPDQRRSFDELVSGIRTVAARVLLTAFVSAGVAGCVPAVMQPAGPVGGDEKTILIDSMAIMLAIVIPTILATLAFAWWYRASNTRAKYRPDWAYSGRIEMVVWAIPALTIMFLGGLIWIGSHQLDPYRRLPNPASNKTGKPLEVQVVSLDWKWLFIYPDQGVASVNTLVVPAGTPVHFTLTSASVMNAFFVPRLGGMIYTMNGMATQLSLQADRPGVFPGLSSHYSGDGFSGMHFDVHALPQSGFDTWVQQAKSAGPTLDAEAYATLSKQSLNVHPYTYRAAAPGLFQAVLTQALPQAPGPSTGTLAQTVSPKSEH